MKASPLEKIVLAGLIGVFIAATCLKDYIREFSCEKSKYIFQLEYMK